MNKDQLQRIIVQLKYVIVQKPRFFEGCVKTKFYSFLNDALDTFLRDDQIIVSKLYEQQKFIKFKISKDST
jgi:hypothetical protein